MDNIVGIRFREGGKIYHFVPGHFVLKEGDEVIVKTEKGLAFGTVATPVRKRDPNFPRDQLKDVFRLANDNDRQQYRECLSREKEAHRFCLERIEKRNLPMTLVDVESFFDGSKIIFYFYADGRVDFRELVKDLVKKLHTRVELRQIGVRNKAKMIGGIGPCGRELCCASFLKEFHSVSVKMAKEQNLSLNPTKISGVCGRLMCCLKYEYADYLDIKTHTQSGQADQNPGRGRQGGSSKRHGATCGSGSKRRQGNRVRCCRPCARASSLWRASAKWR